MMFCQPENIKLILEETNEALEEGKTLADGKAENGAVVYMVFKKPGQFGSLAVRLRDSCCAAAQTLRTSGKRSR